jgi:hypothetical protein
MPLGADLCCLITKKCSTPCSYTLSRLVSLLVSLEQSRVLRVLRRQVERALEEVRFGQDGAAASTFLWLQIGAAFRDSTASTVRLTNG